MKLRFDVNLNNLRRGLLLVQRSTETCEHMALRLSAALLFWDFCPATEPSPKHHALSGISYLPDLMAADEAGALSLWIECGNISTDKLAKLARRLNTARIIAFKESPEGAARLRADLSGEPKTSKIEIIAWPKGEFKRWAAAMNESNHIVGEAGGLSFNLVLNDTTFSTDFLVF